MKKLTVDFIKSEIHKIAPGYHCLSDVYYNNRTKLRIQCDKNHEYLVTWDKLKQGYRCSKCAGNQKLTIEFVKNETIKLAPGYQCFSNFYVNNNTKLFMMCDKNHKYKVRWQDFRNGDRCPECNRMNRLGKGNNRYRHDLTEQERLNGQNRNHDLQTHNWRKNIFERDRYVCQFCLKVGCRLNAHHIHNYADHKDLRFDIDNGITLCITCHKEFHQLFGVKNNNKDQLDRWFAAREKILKIRKKYYLSAL